MPLVATRGAASAQGFGEFAQTAVATYIEDVFSTYLYTGNGSTQTITNGIDLSTYGGLVWGKRRDTASDHVLVDTARGATKNLSSNATYAETIVAQGLTAFTSSGFTVGSSNGLNSSGSTLVSWTFRKAPKFFDVQTFTYSGGVQTVSHALGSAPGVIILKQINTNTQDWMVYHRSIVPYTLALNLTGAQQGNGPDIFGNGSSVIAPTSTQFTVGAGLVSGQSYVAYLFAHNAGGFGLTGTDNVISCGSFTTDASGNATVSLGYEPQWVMYKRTDSTSNWRIVDIMRGWGVASQNAQYLYADSSNAENSNFPQIAVTSTGFTVVTGNLPSSASYIYIAIRRGPMKTPTSGTSVFYPNYYTGNSSANRSFTIGFPYDLAWYRLPDRGFNMRDVDRLRGPSVQLYTPLTSAEGATASDEYLYQDKPTNTIVVGTPTSTDLNFSGNPYLQYLFRRAPGFFDVVCYTGNSPSPAGYSQTLTHNLGVPPELTIVKWRSGATGESWAVMCTSASSSPDRRLLFLDSTAAGGGLNSYFSDASGTPVLPTATQFTVGSNAATNKSTATYVAYLFASVAGVSKVGSYSGTGATQTINCGFTGGARWVMIKRTDSTGDWYVWDTARGMVSGTDPSLLLNSSAAEVNANSVYTTSVGFQIVSTAAGINASGGSYIFLAIA